MSENGGRGDGGSEAESEAVSEAESEAGSEVESEAGSEVESEAGSEVGSEAVSEVPRPARLPSARESVEPHGQRPTPVRLAMDAQREEPEPPELPSTRLRGHDDVEWVVRVEGRTETGGAGDAGAPLIFLTFARTEEPETRVWEVIRVGRSLEALGETGLLAALDEARPYDPDWERSGLFAGTRKQRGG